MFLDVINGLMADRGINKSVLSKESGIPYTTIDGWYKKGYNNIGLATLRKLCQYFGVSLDYLMEQETSISANEQEIINKYRALDTRGKETVRNILDIEYRRSINSKDDEYEIVEAAAHSHAGKSIRKVLSKEEAEEAEEAYIEMTDPRRKIKHRD